jgi:hypothetical protein
MHLLLAFGCFLHTFGILAICFAKLASFFMFFDLAHLANVQAATCPIFAFYHHFVEFILEKFVGFGEFMFTIEMGSDLKIMGERKFKNIRI